MEKVEEVGRREDHILEKLVHRLDEQDEKVIKKEGNKSMVARIFPLLLVVLATMLLLIQISI